MARRNSLFRKIAKTMEEDGFSKDDASNLAKEAIRTSTDRKRKGGSAGGQGGLTPPITIVDDACLEIEMNCDETYKYRSIDGTCNNLKNPYYGTMSTAFAREIAVDEYDPLATSTFLDEGEKATGVPSGTYSRILNRHGSGISYHIACYRHYSISVRSCSFIGRRHDGSSDSSEESHSSKSSSSSEETGSNASSKTCSKVSDVLPSARFVSTNFHTSENVSATVATHMLTQWGQFLDHDITLTPEEEVHDCCAHPETDECFPIYISGTDNFYSLNSVNCLEFTRSVAYCEENGGPRQQINGITSFVDASNVYGSDTVTAASLRSFVDGKLLLEEGGFLPKVNGTEAAGDVRALEMPGLAAMHTLWVREHNRLCDLIKAVEPSFDDETLYQEARRILIAEYQSITYGGYLPVVLGEDNLGENKLKISSEYIETTDPSMTNEFATASYRFGHSMIQGLIKLFSLDNSGQIGEYFLSENFFNVDTYLSFMEQIMMGLITQPAQEMDKEITSEVTNLLFPEVGANFGTDLAARNIQRGRDHGLPGFCCYYQKYDDTNHDCNDGWNRKYRGISDADWKLLQTIYDHPADIDLFTGALAQDPYRGALTGKVFAIQKSKFKTF